jgi:hypothetical protein
MDKKDSIKKDSKKKDFDGPMTTTIITKKKDTKKVYTPRKGWHEVKK